MNLDSISGTGAEAISARLASICSEVLGVPVGHEDDFFALGGDSISATHVMHMASESFGVELSITLITMHTTIAELTAEIERIRANGGT